MTDNWDPLVGGRIARLKAVYALEAYFPSDIDEPFLSVAAAFGFEDWDAFREGMTVETLPALEALAGPNGYAILKAMLAWREQEREDALKNKELVEIAQR